MNPAHFKLIFFVCMLMGATAYAQQENADTVVFSQIRKAELESSHIPQIAHYLTDVAGPRLTNSPGYTSAGKWAIATMQQWGLTNAKFEPWGDFGRPWEIQDFSIMMKSPYPQPLRAYPDPWTANTNGTVNGGVALLTPDQLTDTAYIIQHAGELKDKFVLIAGDTVNTAENFEASAKRYADTDLVKLPDADMIDRSDIIKYATTKRLSQRADQLFKSYGVLAVINATRNNINGDVVVQSRYGYQPSNPQPLPKASMSREDAQRIKRLTESGHKVQLALHINGKFFPGDTRGYNIIAEIPGTDPKLKSQLVMLGGHFDSWEAATGAADNAAGCIVMMEAVRLLDSLHLKPKRTIRIALWGGEEQGLIGSYNYVKNHFMDSQKFTVKPEQATVSAYFNLDNGSGRIRGIYTQNNEPIKPIFEQWLKPFNNLGATTVTTKNTGSTDHLSFDWAGIPAFQFIQDPLDYETRTHHSNMDDYDHLQMNDLKQAAIIVAAFIYQASTRPDMLPRKPLAKGIFVFDGF